MSKISDSLIITAVVLNNFGTNLSMFLREKSNNPYARLIDNSSIYNQHNCEYRAPQSARVLYSDEKINRVLH